MYDFGLLLKQLRKRKNLTQAQLAEKVHKSERTINAYEGNTITPPTEVLQEFAAIFNVSVDYLLGADKREAIIIEQYTVPQKEILRLAAEEFDDDRKNIKNDGLTPRQQEIIARLMNEFAKKK